MRWIQGVSRGVPYPYLTSDCRRKQRMNNKGELQGSRHGGWRRWRWNGCRYSRLEPATCFYPWITLFLRFVFSMEKPYFCTQKNLLYVLWMVKNLSDSSKDCDHSQGCDSVNRHCCGGHGIPLRLFCCGLCGLQ